VRLYCFPHAGGSAAEFLRWDVHLPEAEIWGVHLPGRGGRLAEPAFTDVAACVEALVASATFQPPFVFFGHSLGALLAYETARLLRERGRPEPERLLLSAKAAPHHQHLDPPVRDLAGKELLAEVGRRYGGLPPELAANPDLVDLMLPACRGDFAMVETYRHRPGPPLACPITILGGDADPVPRQHLAGWCGYTTEEVEFRMFPGGHFYFREQWEAVSEVVREALRSAP
jgi:surfactin synthase thioesterase subunit